MHTELSTNVHVNARFLKLRAGGALCPFEETDARPRNGSPRLHFGQMPLKELLELVDDDQTLLLAVEAVPALICSILAELVGLQFGTSIFFSSCGVAAVFAPKTTHKKFCHDTGRWICDDLRPAEQRRCAVATQEHVANPSNCLTGSFCCAAG